MPPPPPPPAPAPADSSSSTSSPPPGTTETETETNRAVIQSYMAALEARDWDRLESHFASPATPYWVLGSPANPPFAGSQPVSARMPQLRAVLGSFPRFGFRVDGLAADGDRVMLYGQLRALGDSGTGMDYVPEIAMAFRLEGGKIAEKREYIDNATVLEWVGRLEARERERERGEGEEG